ncbi:MAG: winged helix-turn-helix domain-containing protein [Cucumibacter sp.]
MQGKSLAFGPFVFDAASATLWRGEALVPLGGRATALLAALLGADSAVVTKADLMERAWPGLFVEEGNLAVQIANLRKVLGTRPDGQEWIATVARVGYRLLHDSGGSSTLSGMPSFAVLPFVNMSGDPEQEYFADGMVEDMITAFSRFKSFSVVARQSSFVYKNRAVDIRLVAKELGVRYVLEGSVRRTGERIRVSAQLIDGANGEHLWAENVDGTIEGVLDFQDRITESVVGLIEPQIRKAEIERARRKRPENLNAYDLYLQALPMVYGKRIARVDDYGPVLRVLERAIALEPGFAPALAMAASMHEFRFTLKGVAPPGVDDAALAVSLSARALAADPNDPMVLMVAGAIRMTIIGDSDGGFAMINQARELNPNSMLILNAAAFANYHRGDYDAAIECNLRSLRLTPGSPDCFWAYRGISRSHISAGRVEESLAWAERALATPIVAYSAHCLAAACYAHLGRIEEARAAVKNAISIWPDVTIEGFLGDDARPQTRDRLLVEGLRAAGMPEG